MNKEFTTYGHVDSNGVLSIYNRNVFVSNIKDYYKNISVELVFRERFYQFSDKQRNYYFAVIVKQIQQAWLKSGVVKSLATVDAEMREKFLYYEELNEDTGLFEKYIHTLKKGDTSVSKKMMREYCEKCIIWCVQSLDWAIAYPSEDFTEDDMTEHQRQSKNISGDDNTTF